MRSRSRRSVIQPLIAHFASQQVYYLVCPDPGGQDVERALRSAGGPLREADLLPQVSELLSALELLHSQHPPLFLGDPVAGDFWLTERGELRIIPFTLARPIGASPIAYRAPELASSAVEPAPPSDIYAVTALLYHVLTGYAPPTYDQIRAGTPLTGPRSLNPAMSPLVEQALLRGLQQRDVNRYQTAREMRVAFETVPPRRCRPHQRPPFHRRCRHQHQSIRRLRYRQSRCRQMPNQRRMLQRRRRPWRKTPRRWQMHQ
ncbi:MAG TPA: serine/threonine-protein kinase [Roseiflexaceae bacterium]|nr:serine/threonine-protein kinase [Roseiflexaceae bacterium]